MRSHPLESGFGSELAKCAFAAALHLWEPRIRNQVGLCSPSIETKEQRRPNDWGPNELKNGNPGN